MTLDDSTETGPLYNVPLLKSLPLGTGAMRQAMPSRAELVEVAKTHERVVAGYEVLLAHYRKQCEAIGSLTEVLEI